jgi:hypothetical protein
MYPAQIPMGTPKHTAIETAKQLAYKAARAPNNNRLKISRPKSSVPSQFNFDGAAIVLLQCERNKQQGQKKYEAQRCTLIVL